MQRGTSPGYEANPIIAGSDVQCSGLGPNTANIRCDGNLSIDGATCGENNRTGVFNPATFYTYTADTANAALQTALTNGAGWQNVTAPASTIPEIIRVLR